MSPRAPALPPEERRAAILASAVPLLATEGLSFTTKSVAEAAGIAEGTIFRIFPTKADLVQAVIDQILDPTDVCNEVVALEPATLDEATRQLVEVMHRAISQTSSLFAALHSHRDELPPPKPETSPHDTKCADNHANIHERRAAQLHTAIVSVLEPFHDDLRLSPADTASLLRSLVMACTHPFLSDGRISGVDQITSVLLHGCAKEPSC